MLKKIKISEVHEVIVFAHTITVKNRHLGNVMVFTDDEIKKLHGLVISR